VSDTTRTKNSKLKTQNCGFMLTEMIVAVTLLATLLVGLALSLYGFARFNRYQLIRQRCIAAAQAQLDSITTMGKPIDDEDFKRLWPKLGVKIKKSAGTGQWQGMKLVEVTANGMSFSKEVKVQLARYVLADEPLAERER
jgi:type II secretory pathway pseudopilin PulG